MHETCISCKKALTTFVMKLNPIIEKLAINKHIAQNNFYDAFSRLRPLVDESNNDSLLREFGSLFDTYKFMLDYMVKGYDDPERETVLKKMSCSLYRLTDKAVAELNAVNSTALYYIRRNSRSADISPILDEYRQISMQIEEFAASTQAADKLPLYEKRERLEREVFNYFWTSFPTTAQDVELVKSILDVNSALYPAYFKQLIMGAVFLSLLQFYDEPLLLSLLNAYGSYVNRNDKEGYEMSMRALTYAVVIIFRHNKKIAISDDVKTQIGFLGEIDSFKDDLEGVFINLIKAKHTDLISQRLEKSIIPDLMNLAPDIIERAKKSNGIIDLSSLEENPEWKDKLNKSGISKKIEELGKMQTRGWDVFLNTFSNLKNYPFFKEMHNWFRPFHYDNSAVSEALVGSTDSIKTIIEHSPFLCDSDRYSFALSMGQLRGAAREMLQQQFDVPDQELSDSDNVPNPQDKRLLCAGNVVKDLYRFFKLFSRRSEFADVFKSDLSLFEVSVLKDYFSDGDIICSAADVYFELHQYKEASECYAQLFETCENVNPINLQKLAFAYQNQGEYRKALKCYINYSLVKEDDVWNLKHIAQCYKALHQPDEAVEYMLKALSFNPDSVQLNLQVGHYLLEDGRIDDAMNYYYKVDYLDDKKHSAWRPLAWCLFLERDFEKSRAYYDKILDVLPHEMSDYMNFGHLCLAEHKFEEAMTYYYNAYSMLGADIGAFRKQWLADADSLVKAGIQAESIKLLADAIALRLD